MRKLIFALLLIATPTWATNANILVSIKPLQLLISSLTEGEQTVEYLISPNVSPHDYALRPSDVRRIRQADLVIWVGDELEPFLSKPLSQTQRAQLALLELKDLQLISGEKAHQQHQHAEHHHEVDPHIWLGPAESRVIAKAITEQLIKFNPEQRIHLQQQLQRFNQRLDQLNKKIDQQLRPVKQQGYFVFHDGYSYFERQFKLNRLGEFTINPQRRPGAKTLQYIRQNLEQGSAQCIFAEPQFDGALLHTISEDSGAKIGLLDPLGIAVVPNAQSYFQLLQNMADAYRNCLSSEQA
ncbi:MULTISPECIES: zinc ABC transporter substrate-binding protein ZnuA [unclassified Agarivorans]|uniref:zinc ABC transporter substrate-binding protein ZnuA n=1 Tax=unclassified Agarivorans TaxID=2636026 RepID=UPI003D7C9F2A